MISSHRIPPTAIYMSSDHSASASFGKGEGESKKATKRHRKENVQSKKCYPHTNSSMYFFL